MFIFFQMQWFKIKLYYSSKSVHFYQSVRLIIGHMHNSQEELLILRNLGINGIARKCPIITPVIWHFLPRNWIKVNIDGAAKDAPGHSGCGGIFRNCRGFSKGWFGKYLSIKYAFEAEILGFIMAIKIAKKFNWSPLWNESNPSYVIIIFSTGYLNIPWEIRSSWTSALLDPKSLTIHVSHTKDKKPVFYAGKLASLSTTLDTNKWWFSAPDFLVSTMYMDMVNLLFYRFMNYSSLDQALFFS